MAMKLNPLVFKLSVGGAASITGQGISGISLEGLEPKLPTINIEACGGQALTSGGTVSKKMCTQWQLIHGEQLMSWLTMQVIKSLLLYHHLNMCISFPSLLFC